jgi:hypothetical protein
MAAKPPLRVGVDAPSTASAADDGTTATRALRPCDRSSLFSRSVERNRSKQIRSARSRGPAGYLVVGVLDAGRLTDQVCGGISAVLAAVSFGRLRDASWLFVVGASWSQKDTPRRVATNLRWLDGLSGALKRYSNGQAYQNFIDPALGDWQRAYYATNIGRLVAAKRKYDPEGLFHFPQGIPLTGSA